MVLFLENEPWQLKPERSQAELGQKNTFLAFEEGFNNDQDAEHPKTYVSSHRRAPFRALCPGLKVG